MIRKLRPNHHLVANPSFPGPLARLPPARHYLVLSRQPRFRRRPNQTRLSNLPLHSQLARLLPARHSSTSSRQHLRRQLPTLNQLAKKRSHSPLARLPLARPLLARLPPARLPPARQCSAFSHQLSPRQHLYPNQLLNLSPHQKLARLQSQQSL
jgi:hypothetical protein